MTDNESSWWSTEDDRQYANPRASVGERVFGVLVLVYAACVIALVTIGGATYWLLKVADPEILLAGGIAVVVCALMCGAVILGLTYVNAATCGPEYDLPPQSTGTASLIRTRDGVLLHAESEGPARAPRTIVFVHGLCNDMRVWHHQRAALPPGHRAVLFDARGHGRSEDGGLDHQIPGLRVLADDLGRVIDETSPSGELVLVGHSMGGMTIFALSAIRPDVFARVRGIMILDSTPGPGQDAVWFGIPWMFQPVIWVIQRYSAAVARIAGLLPDFMLRVLGMGPYLLAMRCFAVSGRSHTALSARRLTARMVYETNPRRYAGHLAGILEHDERRSLRYLAPIPTTIVAGEKDRLIKLSSYDGWLHVLPAARFVSVPGGHMSPLEQPDTVNDELGRLVGQGIPSHRGFRQQERAPLMRYWVGRFIGPHSKSSIRSAR
ncbi:MAG: alpha/beta hydrolase [Nocardiaceae bacterium]|nr:alpha/beta hydrolase [Nocardiaceae bacterium]